jgi:hypothetical protein
MFENAICYQGEAGSARYLLLADRPGGDEAERLLDRAVDKYSVSASRMVARMQDFLRGQIVFGNKDSHCRYFSIAFFSCSKRCSSSGIN